MHTTGRAGGGMVLLPRISHHLRVCRFDINPAQPCCFASPGVHCLLSLRVRAMGTPCPSCYPGNANFLQSHTCAAAGPARTALHLPRRVGGSVVRSMLMLASARCRVVPEAAPAASGASGGFSISGESKEGRPAYLDFQVGLWFRSGEGCARGRLAHPDVTFAIRDLVSGARVTAVAWLDRGGEHCHTISYC